MTALRSGDLNELRQLLSSGADLNSPGPMISLPWLPSQVPSYPLIWAVDVDKPDVVRLLLDGGADPNICCEYYVHGSRVCWLRPLCHTTDHRIAAMLLDAGAEVNAQQRDTNDTETALMRASDSHPTIGELLVERGADVNLKTESDSTALVRAIFHGHQKLIALLIQVSCWWRTNGKLVVKLRHLWNRMPFRDIIFHIRCVLYFISIYKFR